jgi:hypothetical protein
LSINPRNQKILESALQYHNLGFNVIPVNQDKKPLIKWESYQKQGSTKEEIQNWFSRFKDPNIALVTGEISGLLVVDTDTAASIQEVQDFLPENLVTPIQRTPHGGKHFFFKHQEGFSNRARLAPGIDIRTTGGYIVVDPSTNGNGLTWTWIEGLSLFEIEPAPLPDALLSYLQVFAFGFNKGTTEQPQPSTTSDHKYFEFGRRDEDLFHAANTMTKGGAEPNYICNVLERLIFSWGENTDRTWIDAKIKSALMRIERKDRNISEEVKQWVLTTKGHFTTTDNHNGLHLTTKQEKKAGNMALLRMVDDGILERYGEKNGCYRLIESNSDEIDFLNIEDKIVDILWPFEIQEWVKILPKNIIVVAGEANAGKTALLLSTCFMNMGKFKINYFSSEMGAMELRDRLNKFEANLVHWKENINFRERSSNFADVIKPNDVNIIDFLEITDEFYKVGGMIKQIYDKLKKGIAIIALQKNPKTDIGLGGMRSIEKARLYLSMEDGRIKIVKGKNWASSYNPNGISRKFKLVQGAKFIPTTDWQKEDPK